MTTTVNEHVDALRLMVRGAYDLQKLRIQCGLRLCANFRAKLKKQSGDTPVVDDAIEDPPDIDDVAEEEPQEEDLSVEAESLISQLKKSYGRLTDGIAKNRTLPEEKGFVGDELISTFVELILVSQYKGLEQEETKHFSQMIAVLNKIPIYTQYLQHEKGIGPAMAGVLIAYLDPHKGEHVSSFWAYAGLDVAPDGLGRSRREEHLTTYEYIDKNGVKKTRRGVTFNPFLKTKLVGVLAGSFQKHRAPWKNVYGAYKHRLETDPNRIKITVGEWKKKHKAGEEMRPYWPPGRIHNAAQRYMIKCFLRDLWVTWRKLEGLPITPTYHEAVQGHVHTPSAQEQRDQQAREARQRGEQPDAPDAR
jgi:hypothetical protein